MSELERKPARGRPFPEGRSGNPAGRPKAAVAASDINRGLMKRFGSWERLARLAAGLPANEDGSGPVPTITEQLRAIELQAAYAYGRPVQMLEGAGAGGATRIEVTYVDKQIINDNRAQVAIVASESTPGDPGGEAAQRLSLWAPMGKNDIDVPYSDEMRADGSPSILVQSDLQDERRLLEGAPKVAAPDRD